MKRQTECSWSSIRNSSQYAGIPDSLIENSFFLDIENRLLYLADVLAMEIFHRELTGPLPLGEFLQYLSEESAGTLREDIRRLEKEKLPRTDSQIVICYQDENVPALVIMSKEADSPIILGLVHLSYELLHEYKSDLAQIVAELERAQSINQLILEGSTDYIYQLDLVNNVCTFSPKALDVLPLESPTFPNAMDRVLSFIHPEDRHIFLESFTPFLTGKSLFHNAEYRVYTKTGDIMWISCHGKGMHDSTGRPLLIAGSLMDVTEKKRTQERMDHLIYTDMLTGMRNRYCYETDMEACLKKPGAEGSILCIDIRNFKLYNEIFGHHFGNQILKEFAQLLPMYLPINRGIYRLEGDEFLVHLGTNQQDEILEAIAPLQIALSKARVIDGHSIYIDVTIGIAIYPEHGRTSDELLKNADTVLYKLSKYSKDSVMFFSIESSRELSKQYQLENELRSDIEHQFRNFRVVFQPIVTLNQDGPHWCSAEALLRYQNSRLPDVTQKELIETLEMTDLIIPVGRWVLTRAIEECSHWHLTGAMASVHVNFSAQQMSDAGIMEHITRTLKKYGLSAKHLICELTETSLINNFETARQLCRELMELGAGIALDDFGTGYTSFNYLRTLPISQIKIDKTYVENLSENEYNQIIIRCLYDLSKNMGLTLCVEGVEDKETLDMLYGMGARLIQGFYFERPMEAGIVRKEFKQHFAKPEA